MIARRFAFARDYDRLRLGEFTNCTEDDQEMRLVTFETGPNQRRIGAMTTDGQIVDLNCAYALYLRDVEKDPAFYRIADARVPADMRALFEGGDASL
jgi:hypothetical protein